jgi:hypothetical protein
MALITAGGGTPVGDLAWLLDDLADREADFRRAVILSRDGLLIAASKDLSRDDAEHLSAVAAAVQSLAAGTGDHFQVGGVRQTIIELEGASFSSSRRARAVAWPRCARPTPTRAPSPMRWRC